MHSTNYQLYFVYKFRIKKIWLFYIGITNDIDKRKRQHWNGIRIAFNDNKYHLPAYYHICKLLPSCTVVDNNSVRLLCSFEVLDIKNTVEEAIDMENYLISKYKNHPKFLNKK